MIKTLLILFAIGLFLSEFWFLSDLYKESKITTLKINVKRLPPLQDKNSTVKLFFNPKLWKPSKADYVTIQKIDLNVSKEDDNITKNDTIELITKKGTRHLCKGKKCMTIKAIMSDILLLSSEDGKVVSLKPNDVIFDVIKLTKLTDTKLFFENNETGEKYELKFFSYKQRKDTNKSLSEKEEGL